MKWFVSQVCYRLPADSEFIFKNVDSVSKFNKLLIQNGVALTEKYPLQESRKKPNKKIVENVIAPINLDWFKES